MRTWPVPWVWANVMQPVRVQALRWLTMRARRSLGVLSMKLTVSVRGDGPQYLPVTTAMLSGSDGALIPNAPSGCKRRVDRVDPDRVARRLDRQPLRHRLDAAGGHFLPAGHRRFAV